MLADNKTAPRTRSSSLRDHQPHSDHAQNNRPTTETAGSVLDSTEPRDSLVSKRGTRRYRKPQTPLLFSLYLVFLVTDCCLFLLPTKVLIIFVTTKLFTIKKICKRHP